MIEPKIFFRKLDFLLNKINSHKSPKNFLFTISYELDHLFEDDIHLSNPRIYEDDEEYFFLALAAFEDKGHAHTERLYIDSAPVEILLKLGAYIYDNPEFTIDPVISGLEEYTIPAAILIEGPDEKWILTFELKSGWEREEVEFCLTALRTMLNYRIYSDAVKNEMERAVHIQQSLLPAVPPDLVGFEAAHRYQPAELVGGDLYDYTKFDDGMFGVSVGDASGHGLPAALLVRDVITGLRMGLEKHQKMAYTIEKLNKVIYQSAYSSGFVSLFYGELEVTGNLIYVNAGHPAPLIVKEDKVIELEAGSLIIGALPEITIYRQYACLDPGDALIIFSDGIFERENSKGQQFGLERLQKLALKHREESAEDLTDIIYKTVKEFGNKQKWQDDVTLVVVKRNSDVVAAEK